MSRNGTRVLQRIVTMITGAIALLVMLATVPAVAQDLTAEALFRRGAVLFDQEKYVTARLDFREILDRSPDSQWAPSAAMMLAKTYFLLGEFDLAATTARDLRNRYPQSSYASWTAYLEAAVQYRLGNADTAADMLAGLAASTGDATLRTHALGALKSVIVPALGEERVRAVLGSRGIEWQSIADAAPVDLNADRPSLDIILDELPSTGTLPPRTGSGSIRIGLLAPLTGMNAALGARLADGVRSKFATDTVIDGRSVELIVADTESDQVTVVLMAQALADSGVAAIIGPVLTESTISAAVVAQRNGIPFIAPTSTYPGLTRLGDRVFQLNFPPEIQAEALADVAGDALGVRTYAMIATNDTWGTELGDTFSRDMRAIDARQVHTGYFNPNVTSSIDTILMSIRENAPESVGLTDSLVIVPNGTPFPDTVYVRLDAASPGERRLPPVTSIDCIVLSAPSEIAVQLAGQVREYNIVTRILGDSGWWSNEYAIASGGEYLEGAIVVAPPGTLSGGTGAESVRVYHGVPATSDIPYLKGADAAAVLLRCITQGGRDAESIRRQLLTITDFRGTASRITFDPDRRVNTAVDFVIVEQTGYRPVTRDDIRMFRTQYFFPMVPVELIPQPPLAPQGN